MKLLGVLTLLSFFFLSSSHKDGQTRVVQVKLGGKGSLPPFNPGDYIRTWKVGNTKVLKCDNNKETKYNNTYSSRVSSVISNCTLILFNVTHQDARQYEIEEERRNDSSITKNFINVTVIGKLPSYLPALPIREKGNNNPRALITDPVPTPSIIVVQGIDAQRHAFYDLQCVSSPGNHGNFSYSWELHNTGKNINSPNLQISQLRVSCTVRNQVSKSTQNVTIQMNTTTLQGKSTPCAKTRNTPPSPNV